jgi:glycosyltransferase involved in cell wall biosynthesis
MSISISIPTIEAYREDDGLARPVFSVMIPYYEGNQYLAATLTSILTQDIPAELLEIVVVDDCSEQQSPQQIIADIGQNRVSYYRQVKNVGIVENWNTCIRQARGHWVHILHQDDLVLPGFYQSFSKGLQSHPEVGGLFCRHIYMDENSHWMFLSELEAIEDGIIPDLNQRVAAGTVSMQCPSVVIKRATYEALGGFSSDFPYAADIEMWGRVVSKLPIYYEPTPLACWRVHSAALSSKMIRSGQYIIDAYKILNLFKESYFLEIKSSIWKARRTRGRVYISQKILQTLNEKEYKLAYAYSSKMLKLDPGLKVYLYILRAYFNHFIFLLKSKF